MMYSDGVHLISIVSLKDLHEQAFKLDIKRCWYHKSKYPHYDIPKLRRSTFFKDHPQVIKVTSKEIVKLMREAIKNTGYYS